MFEVVEATLAGVAVVCLAGCSAGASKGPVASAGVDTQTAAKPASAAHTECDEYVRLVSHCIENKMPEGERAGARQTLDMSRAAFAGNGPIKYMPAMDLQSYCTDLIREKIEGDEYGCYTEEAKKRGIQTVCSVMTKSELSDILGAPIEEGVQDGSTCRYAFTGPAAREPFKIALYQDGRNQLSASRAAQKWMNSVSKGLPLGADDFVDGTRVDGLGDDAFMTSIGAHWPRLVARQDNVAVELFGGSGDQLIAIARKALPRIYAESRRRHAADNEPAGNDKR